jgi:hypothetical protein
MRDRVVRAFSFEVPVLPLQNRVDPFGLLHAVPDRGLFMGNRGGCFHRDDQTLKDRRWASKQWIICVLSFKDRRRALMQPGLYTELFFLDEATALAAGHRPCFECRRPEAKAFRDGLVRTGHLAAGERIGALDAKAAGEIQDVLTGKTVRETASPASLPDGAFYAAEARAWLKHQGEAREWSFAGYGRARSLHDRGQRLTPQISCDALRAGYQPTLHTSAIT